MIHPSYVELMKVVNEGVEIGEEPVVSSRYSILFAAAKRAIIYCCGRVILWRCENCY